MTLDNDYTTKVGFTKYARKAVTAFVSAGAGAAAAALTLAYTDLQVTAQEWGAVGLAFAVFGLISGFAVFKVPNDPEV